MTKVLVTGGAGYVGCRLVPQLLTNGYEVRLLDNLMYNQTTLLAYFLDESFEFMYGDIRDRGTVTEALSGVDFIIHLAAIVGAPACKKDPKLAKEVNEEATLVLNDCRSDSQGLIFASTGSNYGAVDGICTEETPLNPLSEYGITKTAAEIALLESGDTVVYRFATAFGLSERLRLDLLINDFTFQALTKHQLDVYEEEFRRTFIHVYDMARSFIHALKHYDEMSGQVYNVGDESMNYTKRDVATMIQAKTGCYVHYAAVGSDPDQRDYEVSYEKIRATGFKTTINLETGIDELIKSYRMINLGNVYSNV